MAVTTEPRNHGSNHGDTGFRSSVLPWWARRHGVPQFRASVVAQSAVEYAVLMAVVVAALVGMSIYTKRALSGRWRAVGDTFGYGRQYEPGTTVVSSQ